MTDQPWVRRQQVPDLQVRDAADQYDNARRILLATPPESGTLLPLLNSGAVSVELYLKSLGSQLIYRPDPSMPDISQIYSKPDKTHALEDLYDAMPHDVQTLLESTFRHLKSGDHSQTFRQTCAKYNGLFASSRYPFEPDIDVTQYPLDELMRLCDFLRTFVHGFPYRETIHWR